MLPIGCDDGSYECELTEISIFTNGVINTRMVNACVLVEKRAVSHIRTRDNKFYRLGDSVLNTCFNGEPKSVVVVIEPLDLLNCDYITRVQRSLAAQMLEALEIFSNRQKEIYSKAADMCSSFKQQAGDLL